MKTRFFKISNYAAYALILSCIITIASVSSCKKDAAETIAVYEQNEQIGKKIKELNDLLLASTFGNKKDMYPVESKSIIEDKIADLKKLLQDIKTQIIAPQNVSAETGNRLKNVATSLTQFLASKRTENLYKRGELHVMGREGGYVDFGSASQFSNFTNGFTVEFWVKFDQIGPFSWILSNFSDGNPRNGWGANYYGHGGNSLIRMTYALSGNQLFEPGIQVKENGRADLFNLNEWVHLAYVWNPSQIDDGSGSARTFKLYINGELFKDENWSDTSFVPNLNGVHLVGFNHPDNNGNIAADENGTNGYMKHVHIWNSVKSKAQLINYKNNPDSILGTETDLVCGWKLTEIPIDGNVVRDITDRYNATIHGNFNWVEQ